MTLTLFGLTITSIHDKNKNLSPEQEQRLINTAQQKATSLQAQQLSYPTVQNDHPELHSQEKLDTLKDKAKHLMHEIAPILKKLGKQTLHIIKDDIIPVTVDTEEKIADLTIKAEHEAAHIIKDDIIP